MVVRVNLGLQTDFHVESETLMELDTYSAPIIEAWATWSSLRNLGFDTAEIYWEFKHSDVAIPVPGLALNVVLRAQGLEMSIVCSLSMHPEEAHRLNSESHDFATRLNANVFDHKDLEERFHRSMVQKNRVHFLSHILRSGFTLPIEDQDRLPMVTKAKAKVKAKVKAALKPN